MSYEVLVVGAGVTGLTTAVVLAEAGHRVTVCTADPPERTTSAAAGALWGPYLTEPRELIRRFSLTSLDTFTELAGLPGTGVSLVRGVEAGREPVEPPDWADLLPDFAVCARSELPDGFVAGWRFTAPMIDMPVYLAYLRNRLDLASGTVELRRIDTLAEATNACPIVINCTGLGARQLAGDPSLTAIRGDLIVVDQPTPRIEEFFSEETGSSPQLLHLYPQRDHVVLGGTALPGRTSREPDERIASAILDRCAAVEPRLSGAVIREHRVGLRPTRPGLRLEPEERGETVIIHNYGHGGSGVTLSWGCSTQVLTLVERSRS